MEVGFFTFFFDAVQVTSRWVVLWAEETSVTVGRGSVL